MEEIRLGLETGLDVLVYAKPEFDAYQMSDTRLELYGALFAEPEHDLEQREEIKLELEKSTPKYKDTGEPTREQIIWCRQNALPMLNRLTDNELWNSMKDTYEKAHQE